MAKFVISCREAYPVYDYDEPYKENHPVDLIEIPDSKIRWIEDTIEEYKLVQSYLRDLKDGAYIESFCKYRVSDKHYYGIEKLFRDYIFVGLCGALYGDGSSNPLSDIFFVPLDSNEKTQERLLLEKLVKKLDDCFEKLNDHNI